MRGLVAAAIFAVASANNAAACSPGILPTPSGLVSAHTVAKVAPTQVEDSNVPYALVTFETLRTYSGEEESEWRVVWQKGLSSLSEPAPFIVGETYIVGLVQPDRSAIRRCPRSVLPCIRKGDGTYYPEIMTHHCIAPASYAFAFSDGLETQVRHLLEAAR